MLSVEDKLYILKLIQSYIRVLFEQLCPESTAGFCIAAKKRVSFKQDISFIIYNKNKSITYHNIEHKDNYYNS